MELKDKIIIESLKLFSTNGFSATSTSDIIKAAGTSKGGLYNHFKSKDELFLETLSLARKIWRERNLYDVESVERPLDKIVKILENYKDRYLTDSENLPGGCIFINMTIELNGSRPDLAKEVNEGFIRLKNMLNRFFNEEKHAGTLNENVHVDKAVEMIFSGLLGACVLYTSDKSKNNLTMTISSLVDYINGLKN